MYDQEGGMFSAKYSADNILKILTLGKLILNGNDTLRITHELVSIMTDCDFETILYIPAFHTPLLSNKFDVIGFYEPLDEKDVYINNDSDFVTIPKHKEDVDKLYNYGFLSNFFLTNNTNYSQNLNSNNVLKVIIEDQVDVSYFKTSEGLFQFSKKLFTHNFDISDIKKFTESAHEAFSASRKINVSSYPHTYHNSYKIAMMYLILCLKFNKKANILNKKLLETNMSYLLEYGDREDQWGVNSKQLSILKDPHGNMSGKNILGKLLMIVRSQIQELNGTNKYAIVTLRDIDYNKNSTMFIPPNGYFMYEHPNEIALVVRNSINDLEKHQFIDVLTTNGTNTKGVKIFETKFDNLPQDLLILGDLNKFFKENQTISHITEISKTSKTNEYRIIFDIDVSKLINTPITIYAHYKLNIYSTKKNIIYVTYV